jgi:hypothetical protein
MALHSSAPRQLQKPSWDQFWNFWHLKSSASHISVVCWAFSMNALFQRAKSVEAQVQNHTNISKYHSHVQGSWHACPRSVQRLWHLSQCPVAVLVTALGCPSAEIENKQRRANHDKGHIVSYCWQRAKQKKKFRPNIHPILPPKDTTHTHYSSILPLVSYIFCEAHGPAISLCSRKAKQIW